MIYCKLHPDTGTLIRLKGPHIGAYYKQCNKWLKWITIDEVDECIDPILDSEFDAGFTQTNTLMTTLATQSEPFEDDDDVPW